MDEGEYELKAEEDGHQSKIKTDMEDYKLFTMEESEAKSDIDKKYFVSLATDIKLKNDIKWKSETKFKNDIIQHDSMNSKSFFKLKFESCIGFASNELLSICKSKKCITDISNDLDPEQSDNDVSYSDQHQHDSLDIVKNGQTKRQKKSVYKRKNKKKDKNEIFICSQCSYRSQKRDNLVSHLKIHLGTRNIRKLHCAYCDYGSQKREALINHLASHGVYGGKPEHGFKCSYCGSTFSNRNNMTRHYLRTGHDSQVLQGKSFKLHRCSNCSKEYGTRFELFRHMMVHTQERPFKCANCDYATTRRDLLEMHLVRHSRLADGKKTFDSRVKNRKGFCHVEEKRRERHCGKDFKLNSNEVEDEKWFKCAICDYRSLTKRQIEHHILRQHTKEPVFRCSSCDYSTFCMRKLRAHRKNQQHNIFYCEHCDYTCSKYLNIQRHMNTHFQY